MFDKDRFIEDCIKALEERSPQAAVQELVSRAVSDPGAIVDALGAPSEAGIQTVYRSDALTILNVVWAPMMQLYPHEHLMWAVIGIYGGQEDNSFYRRRKDGAGLEPANGRSLAEHEVLALGRDVIHAVTNPKRLYTGGIHVYGGDFFAVPRSEWSALDAPEQPFSIDRARQTFAEANERARELMAKG